MENNNTTSSLIFERESDDFKLYEKKGSLLQTFAVKSSAGVTIALYKKWGKKDDEIYKKGKYEIDYNLTPIVHDEFSDFFTLKVDMNNVVFKKKI